LPAGTSSPSRIRRTRSPRCTRSSRTDHTIVVPREHPIGENLAALVSSLSSLGALRASNSLGDV
jgi:hypothetical protein